MATPDQCKRQIEAEWKRLKDKKNGSVGTYNIIKARAKEAARHGGIPECWRNYLPEGFKKEYGD